MRTRLPERYLLLIGLSLIVQLAFAGSEYVTVVSVPDNGDKAVIQRANGEQWLIEKGIGAMSLWRYANKNVIISSPGLFCGIGSQLIIAEADQKARIWDAELLTGTPRMPIDMTPSGAARPSPVPLLESGVYRITDLLTSEEKQKAGLSKLSDSELAALDAAVLRILSAAPAIQENRTIAPPTALADGLDFYDSTGAAIAYISLNDDLVIYLWSGKPSAYLDGDSVYGFNGKHLGWLKQGIVYDNEGDPVAALKDAFREPVKTAPVKGLKELKPLKSLKELKPLKPLFTTAWSDTPALVFFWLGTD